MMLPLCTIVTLLRLLSIAYFTAARNSRSVPSLRGGLQADAGAVREADLGVLLREILLEQVEEFLALGRALLEFDARINVLGVLAEDDHVDFFRRLDRRGHALEPAHRPQAHIQIQQLAQRHVQRTNAAADRRGERSLDRDQIVAAGGDRFVGQPGVVGLVGFLAGENLHPMNLALAAVGLLHRGVEHPHARPPDVAAGAVAFDERNDGLVGHVQFAVRDADLLAPGGDLAW